MSVYLYDEAIVNKLRFWFNDPNISVADPDTVLSYRADVSPTDEVKLNIVSLTRLKWEITSKGKTPLSRDGWKYKGSEKNIEQLRAIPIRIDYQIDFISRKRKQNDNLVREFVYKILNNPKLVVSIPYNDSSKTHNFSINIDSVVEDNSDIAQHLDKGERFRSTLTLSVEDAYLFAYTIKDTVSIDADVDTK